MDGTGPGRYDQSPSAVLDEQPWCSQSIAVSHRVAREAGQLDRLVRQGQHLPQKRVGRVSTLHPCEKSAWNQQWKLPSGSLGTCDQRLR
jgi:hypothetical protein